MPEKYAVEVPEDLDPAEVVSLIFPYMTAYQMLHRTARVQRGETVLVHGAAGRVGTAALELGAVAGLRLIGTASARDRAAVERLGAVAIDYRNEDFLARVRELTGGEGVDVVLDGIGGAVSLRSFRALRVGDPITGDPGGRLIMIGNYNTMVQGRKSWRGWIEWWPATAIVWLWGTLSPRRRVMGYRVQKLRIPHQDWFREDFRALLELLREGKIHPVVAERLPLSEARRAHEMLEQLGGEGKARARAIGRRGRSLIARGAGWSSRASRLRNTVNTRPRHTRTQHDHRSSVVPPCCRSVMRTAMLASRSSIAKGLRRNSEATPAQSS